MLRSHAKGKGNYNENTGYIKIGIPNKEIPVYEGDEIQHNTA